MTHILTTIVAGTFFLGESPDGLTHFPDGIAPSLLPDGSGATVGPMWAKRFQDRPTLGDPGGGRLGPVGRLTHCPTNRLIREFTVRIEESLGTSLCRA